MPYDEAHRLQLAVRDRVLAGAAPPTLLLLEHDPVITLGRRGQTADVLVSSQELERLGIAVRRAERGGLVTYHGPGQLVGYPIVSLRALACRVPEYVWRLEEALIATAAHFGVAARRTDQRGVWVGDAKLASIGIAVTRGVCWHGFALNVDPDLGPFQLIRPCGADQEATSLAQDIGSPPGLEAVAEVAAKKLGQALELSAVNGLSMSEPIPEG